MHAELEALLSLQSTDARIADIEQQLESLSPRLRDLERKRTEKAEAVTRARNAVQVEERRRQEIERRLAQHRQLEERNTRQLDSVHNIREAGAATSQLEVTRRIIAEDEVEARGTAERIRTLEGAADELQLELEQLEQDIEAAHAEVSEQRAALEADLEEARAERDGKAWKVGRAMLGKYDRIRGRRAHALFPVRGQSCGNCDTAIPLHRQRQMSASGGIEVCEVCGVLLYIGGDA